MRVWLVATAGLAASGTALAHDGLHGRSDTVIVYGRGLSLLGQAKTASEGVVGYADFTDRPLSRAGELVEVIPGAVATQHSGEGKANQYFLRGFNLDHGTDFSASVDGVPVNLRTHGHGQGYLDLNFVIPEIVERVDYRKGPTSAQSGDFSSAGSARYSTYTSLDAPFIEATLGEFGFGRLVAAGSFEPGADTTVLLAGEAAAYDGPWVLDQDLSKLNLFAKVSHRFGPARVTLTGSFYDSTWVSTDQVPERAVREGRIDRFGFIDSDLGGATSRASLALTTTFDHESGAVSRASAYLVDYRFKLFSNFTYFADDPVDGDEFEQRDRRVYAGGAVAHERTLGAMTTLRVGAEARYDDIRDIGLFRTAGRERLSTVRLDSVEQLSLAAWAEAEVQLGPTLRAIGGLRADYFEADVAARSLPENSGSADDSLVSPSLGVAWRARPDLELYASYGQGFHSNDARGATIRTDPVSGEAADRVPLLVRSQGGELGLRYERDAVRATLTVFQLDLDSELVFVGDAGTTEPNDASTRTGVEASLFWTPNDWLVLDVAAATTDARFDIGGGADRIPGAVETVIGAGLVARVEPWTLSARVRHFGSAPLIEDNSVRSDPTTVVNAGASYRGDHVSVGLEVLNLFDAQDADITYFFGSRLRDEADVIDDRHFHPVEPRMVRVSLRYTF